MGQNILLIFQCVPTLMFFFIEQYEQERTDVPEPGDGGEQQGQQQQQPPGHLSQHHHDAERQQHDAQLSRYRHPFILLC